MAYSLVQSKAGKGNSGTSVSVTGLTATTAGNLLLMIVDGDKNPGDVTFTPPANWVQVGATQHQDVFIAISGTAYYYPNNPGGITSVAVTASSSLSAWHCYFLEFSGVATSSPLDAQAVTTRAGTTTPSSGNITTTQAGDLLIGWISEDDVNGAYTLTQPGGWTALARNQDAGQWSSLYVAYKTAGAAGTESYSPTLSSTATDSVIGVMAFLAAGGGGGGTVNGSGALIANSAVAETGAQLSNPSAPITANAALTETAAQLVTTATPVASNSALAQQAAQIVTHGATLAANSGMTVAGQVVSASDTLAANAALIMAAQIVNPQALVRSDAALVITGHIETPPPQLISNSALVQSGAQLVDTSAPITAQSALVASPAQLVVRAVAFVAQSVLVASGVVLGQTIPGDVALSDARTASAALSDALVSRAALTDARIAAVALSDA